MIERTQGTQSRPLVSIDELRKPVLPELDRVQEEMARFFVSDVQLINDISKHMLRGHGKRLRPTLLLLVNKLAGRVTEKSIIAATMVELVHTATLVHDDSIDRSFLRRGLPTVNSLWNDQTSVIMGDYLYSKAFFMLVENDLYPAVEILARTTHRMSLGEMLDLQHELNFTITEDEYLRLIQDKTAVLISAACEIGGLLGWGMGRESQLLSDFGMRLGMAFQITDDILDIEGDAELLGKSTGSDIRDGKITLPIIHSLAEAPPERAERIRTLMGDVDLDENGAAEVARFTVEQGGIQYARQRARGYADRALELLDAFPEGSIRNTLHDAVEYVLERRR